MRLLNRIKNALSDYLHTKWFYSLKLKTDRDNNTKTQALSFFTPCDTNITRFKP